MKARYGLEAGEPFRRLGPNKGWTGWIRRDLPEGLLSRFVEDPESLFGAQDALFLKNGAKTKVVKRSFQDETGRAWEVVIKRIHYGSAWRRLGFFCLNSPAVRSLEGALLLQEQEIPTPKPLAALEGYRWSNLGTSYYVSEDVPGGEPLLFYWRDQVAKGHCKALLRKILTRVARLFYELHSRVEPESGNECTRRNRTRCP